MILICISQKLDMLIVLVRNLTCRLLSLSKYFICKSWSRSTTSKYFYGVKYLRTILFRPFYWTLTPFFSSSTQPRHNYLFIIFKFTFIIIINNNITKQTVPWWVSLNFTIAIIIIIILASYSAIQNCVYTYLIFVIIFTRAKFLENKIYTEKTRKLRQNTQ